MELAQIGRAGDLGQAEFAPTIGAHKFNGAAQPAVDNPYARQFNLVRPLRVDVRPEQVNRELIDERADHLAPARVPSFNLGRDRFERGAQLRVSGQRRERRAEEQVSPGGMSGIRDSRKWTIRKSGCASAPAERRARTRRSTEKSDSIRMREIIENPWERHKGIY